MNVKVIYNFLPFKLWGWIRGMTIYPFIFFKYGKKEVDDVVFRHEMEHIYQVRRIGWIRFYLSYIWQNIRHGYTNNKYEIAARDVQNTPLTPEERKIKDNS